MILVVRAQTNTLHCGYPHINHTGANAAPEKSQKRRESKSKKQPDDQNFLPRINSPWKVGAHVSSSGGVENSVVNAAMIGYVDFKIIYTILLRLKSSANAFALFLKSQRKWTSPPLSEHSIKTFKERMVEHKYSADMVLPHGSYLINLGNPDLYSISIPNNLCRLIDLLIEKNARNLMNAS
jgi:AP endonuclease-1